MGIYELMSFKCVTAPLRKFEKMQPKEACESLCLPCLVVSVWQGRVIQTWELNLTKLGRKSGKKKIILTQLDHFITLMTLSTFRSSRDG